MWGGNDGDSAGKRVAHSRATLYNFTWMWVVIINYLEGLWTISGLDVWLGYL